MESIPRIVTGILIALIDFYIRYNIEIYRKKEIIWNRKEYPKYLNRGKAQSQLQSIFSKSESRFNMSARLLAPPFHFGTSVDGLNISEKSDASLFSA